MRKSNIDALLSKAQDQLNAIRAAYDRSLHAHPRPSSPAQAAPPSAVAELGVVRPLRRAPPHSSPLMPYRAALLLLRVPYLRHRFSRAITASILRRVEVAPDLTLTELICDLVESRSAVFSYELLNILALVPSSLAETSFIMRTHFVKERLRSSTVHEGICTCRSVLADCGRICD